MVSFLGSLCGSLAEKVTCNVFCCQKPVEEQEQPPPLPKAPPISASAPLPDPVRIPPSVQSDTNLLALFGANDFDLRKFVYHCHPSPSLSDQHDTPHTPDPMEDLNNRMRWLMRTIRGAQPEDTLSRLKYVLSISNLDLEAKARDRQGLTVEEKAQLREVALQVKDLGNYAAHLWRVVANHKVRWDDMRQEMSIHHISYLKSRLRKFSNETITGKNAFSKLDVAFKEYFFKAVQQDVRWFEKHKILPEPWNHPIRHDSNEDRSSDSIKDLAYGPADPPQMLQRAEEEGEGAVAALKPREVPVHIVQSPDTSPSVASRALGHEATTRRPSNESQVRRPTPVHPDQPHVERTPPNPMHRDIAFKLHSARNSPRPASSHRKTKTVAPHYDYPSENRGHSLSGEATQEERALTTPEYHLQPHPVHPEAPPASFPA
jgi:hypothetical protein